ncbi:MAG: amino acid ABC transporter ATP-binding protein, partial [Clostridia bacterium]|nr:amino acid ABC transporter ATP-binding protein [Clostridia bacterium]
MIEVKNLTKTFNNKLKVLDDISIDIHQGEKVVIIGPSGSGKSTFLRCLNMLEKPTAGKIFFEGQQINTRKCDINKVRQKMGMVFQQFNLFPHFTILENITFAPIKLKLMTKEQAIARAEELLKRINLFDKRDVYPSTLSGGQK